MVLSVAGYVINDAAIKLVAEDLPLFQSILIRGLFITTGMAIVAARQGVLVQLFERLERPMIIRFSMETIGTVLYLTALTQLPLAGITAVLQIVPIAVTFAAARVLREPLSPVRIAAVLAGFVGVLTILRPWSDTFSPWYLGGLAVVGIVVIRELATKGISNDIPALVIALGTAISITTMGGVFAVIDGWDTPTTDNVGLLALAACFLAIGYLASILTVRAGDLSFSAPFRYSVMVFAIILQIVVFDELPDRWTILGSTIIAAAGIWAFRHEQRAARTVAASR